ncbi:MAG: TIM barrel protein [Firmicutes bacterium]|nr:TIM barrel protein [Bacillota bacterium]
MDRKFLIIPEFGQLDRTMELAEQYQAGFEYNDFFSPKIYEDESEIKRRCNVYKQLDRDRSRDTLHGVFLDMAVTSTDTVIRNHSRRMVLQSMEVAENLGVKGVVFHSGLIAELQIASYLDAWLNESEIFWHTMAERYPETDIYLENTFERTPDMLIKLKKRLADVKNFKLCLDYGHACLTPTPIEGWVEEMKDFTGHIHLNDNDLKADLHQVPGEGKIDFEKCRMLLQQCLPQASILLELNGIDKQRKALEYMSRL